MSWTNSHQELAIKNCWWQSTINIASYIYKKVNSPSATEFEFDTKKFQKYITKLRGKPYHRTLIPKAIDQLEQQSEGLVVIIRDYKRGVYKLLVRPISFLKENKSSQRENKLTQNAGNPLFSDEYKKKMAIQQQQDLNKIKRLTRDVGLIFDEKTTNKLWRLSGKSIEEITKAIKFFLHRNSTNAKEIKNPEGFLINTLREGWAKDFDLYYSRQIPVFNNCMAIDTFVDNISKKIEGRREAFPKPN